MTVFVTANGRPRLPAAAGRDGRVGSAGSAGAVIRESAPGFPVPRPRCGHGGRPDPDRADQKTDKSLVAQAYYQETERF